nr:hypothetical protein [Saccharothrix saharensis]
MLEPGGADALSEELRVVAVVVQAAGLVEQLTDGDPAAVVAVAVDQAGQPALDGVVEAQQALGHQLEDDGGGERLGRAADPEPVLWSALPVGSGVRRTGGAEPLPVAVVDLGHDAGSTGLGGGVEGALHLGAFGGVVRGGCGDGISGLGGYVHFLLRRAFGNNGGLSRGSW